MAVEVRMPRFGLTMHEGTIRRLFRRAGEAVTAQEPLYEVETEKVLTEVAAPASGVVALLRCAEGQEVACGELVAVIAEPGEDAAQVRRHYAGEDAAPVEAAPAAAGARLAITPVARKRAAELGIDAATLAGSGPGGRITLADVERAGAGAGPRAPRPLPRPTTPARTIAFAGLRRTIADRMTQSLRDCAQLTLTTEADVTAATELKNSRGRQLDFTYSDLMVHAVARALRRHPRLNARLDGDTIVLLDAINIGVAVALPEGLIVPVVHNADRLSLAEIAATTADLFARARDGRLGYDDVADPTFTISNLGPYGIDAFTPIINPGQAAVLGLGRILERPAVYNGEIVKRMTMTLSLTFDHRLLDGAPAAGFLQTVIETFNYGER